MINNLINIPTQLHLRMDYVIRRRDDNGSKRFVNEPKGAWKHIRRATLGGERPVRRVHWRPVMGHLRRLRSTSTSAVQARTHRRWRQVMILCHRFSWAELKPKICFWKSQRMGRFVCASDEPAQTLLTTTNRIIPDYFSITVSIREQRNDDTIAGIGRRAAASVWQ